MFDENGVGLADQHDDEGSDHDQAKGEALHDRAHLARDHLEVVPNRHVRLFYSNSLDFSSPA